MLTQPHDWDAERLAYAYLSAVTERPSASLWDLLDQEGAIVAAERIRCGAISSALADQSAARRHTIDPRSLARAAAAVGARFVTPSDPEWPSYALDPLDTPRRLAKDDGNTVASSIALKPVGLWCRGPAALDHVTDRSLAIVGTRASTSYGRAVAADLATGAVAEDFAVISGGAFGIDAAAHRAVLGTDGVSVAVLASGIDRLYPSGNSKMLEALTENGAVISAHPPGMAPTRYRFLDRNRLIAALSRATVVVEAAARSGALSTARWAIALRRPVGAVPGPVNSVASVGCHLAIRNGQAILVSRPQDLLELAGDMGESAPDPTGENTRWDGLDDVTRRVLEALPLVGGASPAEIACSAGVAPAVTRAILGRLLAQGVVGRAEGKWRRLGSRGRQLSLEI